jgi:hypothetical protein
MAYISQEKYYENNGVIPKDVNWGSYQYISLSDIVTNFLLMYSGNHSLINNEERYKILFHAKRAVQELNYDAFKEIKVLQLEVTNNLIFVLPSDYVNWVRISLYKNGLLRPLTENIQTLTSIAYLQGQNGKILFNQQGEALSPQNSSLVQERLNGVKKSIYLNQGNQFNGQYGWNYDGMWYFEYNVGAAFGLNTETANFNPTFTIDKKAGVINFDHSMANEQCVVEYVSDGMENGDDSLITINKMFEDYIYAEIEYSLLSSKLGVQEYVINRARKRRRALYNNAKIRISNIHPGRLLMNMRGMDKQIK